jgi:transposase
MDEASKKRKRYDKEFKVNAVQLSLEPGRSTASVARDLGIDSNRLYHWKQIYLRDAEEAFPGKGHLKASDEQTRKYQNRIAELEEEVAILKKAMGYFSSTKKKGIGL